MAPVLKVLPTCGLPFRVLHCLQEITTFLVTARIYLRRNVSLTHSQGSVMKKTFYAIILVLAYGQTEK